MVERYIGRKIKPKDCRYVDFSMQVNRLIDESSARGITPTLIDHYYWLRGMFDADDVLKRDFNLETRLVLSSGNPEVQLLIRDLLGTG